MSGKVLSVVLDAANVCWAFVESQPGWAERMATLRETGRRLRPPMTGLLATLEFCKWKKWEGKSERMNEWLTPPHIKKKRAAVWCQSRGDLSKVVVSQSSLSRCIWCK